MEPHETSHRVPGTEVDIAVADPDQGTPYILVNCAMPSTSFQVYEPFDDATPGGHNIMGFLRRWEAWAAGDAPFLYARELRFGFPMAFPRAMLGESGAVGISIQYHRKDDARASFRSGAIDVPGQPRVRSLGNGVIAVDIPRG